MHRRGSLRGFALRVSFAVALLAPAAFAGCGDDDTGGGIDAGFGGTGGVGTGGNGTGGMGTGGMGTGGMGTGGMGTGGMGTGGMGTGGMMGGDEDAGLDGGSSGSGGSGSDAGQAGTFRTVDVMMSAMTPHVGSLMQFRIVSNDNTLVALGVLDPLPSASATFSFPDSTPEGSDFRLDFWADANDDRMYDADDHQWRRDVPATDPAVISFTHTTTFMDISMPTLQDGLDFTFNASGMTPEMNKPLELRVIDADSKQLVGRYVLGSIAGATFSLKLPGIITSGHSYQVDLFTDENGNGDYDAPPTDHAWRVTQDATAGGLTVAFAYSTTYTDVGF